MFILTDRPAYWWPVRWTEPQDGGATVEREIELKLVLVDNDEFAAIGAPVAGFDALPETEKEALNLRHFRALCESWRGIASAPGKPLPFEDAWIVKLQKRPNFIDGFARSYAAFRAGQPELIRKNSEPSPAGGPEARGGAETSASPCGPTSRAGG